MRGRLSRELYSFGDYAQHTSLYHPSHHRVYPSYKQHNTDPAIQTSHRIVPQLCHKEPYDGSTVHTAYNEYPRWGEDATMNGHVLFDNVSY
jgi:hypothetical protein